jgi:hypothetical protein
MPVAPFVTMVLSSSSKPFPFVTATISAMSFQNSVSHLVYCCAVLSCGFIELCNCIFDLFCLFPLLKTKPKTRNR